MSHLSACGLLLMVAAAQPVLAQGPFNMRPIDDVSLSAERGSYRPSDTLLTAGKLLSISDETARSDFRLNGSVGNIIMDDWWSTNGALLIDARRDLRS